MPEPKNPCPSCDGTGEVAETLRYTQPPPGDSIWATNTKRAYPPVNLSDYDAVASKRTCCRCGGRGEKPRGAAS